MAEVYMGQIMMTGFGYAPRGFAQCNGQLLAISQYNALFALLGTVYGGDGRTTFGLPDLRSCTPAGGGYNSVDAAWQPPLYARGTIAGSETVALNATQIPTHLHTVAVTSATATEYVPSATQTLGASDGAPIYGPASSLVPLAAGPLSSAGSGLPHPNIQPYQAINFNVALAGYFPSRS